MVLECRINIDGKLVENAILFGYLQALKRLVRIIHGIEGLQDASFVRGIFDDQRKNPYTA